jgi:hypothetical protein
MGTDNLSWKRKNKPLKRKSGNKGTPPISLLIACEGEETEPNYFSAFRLSSANVKVVGCGKNTLSLVEEALEIRRKARVDEEEYDQVWCVFDRDKNTPQNINAAFDLAERKGIKIAYSNEAFELWYLLHFQYMDTGITRDDYKKRLSKLLGYPYQKNSQSMYRELLLKQGTALKNAENLLKTYSPRKPVEDNPSTTVHLLVRELNRFLP